jgi:LmbE family N-acetylglucosaminyl deacetylase
MTGRRILGVFAHPDDEVFCAGGTLAKYVSEGDEVMVLCATRGEGGQIRDAAIATRASLPTVREGELRAACACLGVHRVTFLDHIDGTLATIDFSALVHEVEAAIDAFDPAVVITFGPDGAYGHPDHITIGEAATEACRSRGDRRLFHSYFPRSRLLLLERVAEWLTEVQGRFKGPEDFARVFSLFAQETNTMGFADDNLRVAWFPAGVAIVEQGEAADALYLILSGEVEVSIDDDDGGRRHVRRSGPGEFFGEVAIAQSTTRTAHVVAADSVTCLVFARRAPDPWAGRGALVDGEDASARADTDPQSNATTVIDVRGVIDQKIAAIAAHRTQYPIDPAMFPRWMLEEMMGHEHFVQVLPATGQTTDLFA